MDQVDVTWTWWRHPITGVRLVRERTGRLEEGDMFVPLRPMLGAAGIKARVATASIAARVDGDRIILRPAKLYEGGPTGWCVEIGEWRPPRKGEWFKDVEEPIAVQSAIDWHMPNTILEPLPTTEFEAHGVDGSVSTDVSTGEKELIEWLIGTLGDVFDQGYRIAQGKMGISGVTLADVLARRIIERVRETFNSNAVQNCRDLSREVQTQYERAEKAETSANESESLVSHLQDRVKEMEALGPKLIEENQALQNEVQELNEHMEGERKNANYLVETWVEKHNAVVRELDELKAGLSVSTAPIWLTDEMVEEGARAAYEDNDYGMKWDAASDYLKRTYLRRLRVGFEAWLELVNPMEVTDEMIERALDAMEFSLIANPKEWMKAVLKAALRKGEE